MKFETRDEQLKKIILLADELESEKNEMNEDEFKKALSYLLHQTKIWLNPLRGNLKNENYENK